MPSLENALCLDSDFGLANIDKQEKMDIAVGTDKMTLVMYVGDSKVSSPIQYNMALVLLNPILRMMMEVHGCLHLLNVVGGMVIFQKH